MSNTPIPVVPEEGHDLAASIYGKSQRAAQRDTRIGVIAVVAGHKPAHGSDRATPAARVSRRGAVDAANGLCQRIFSWELSTRHDGGPSSGALH